MQLPIVASFNREVFKMDIIQIKKELRIDSRLLAGQLDHRHRTILENIDRYKTELESLSELPFQTEAGVIRKQGGTSTIRYALLTEDQCYFVLTLMRNNQNVVALKLKLVKAFRDARKQIANRDMARLSGKQVRRDETDAIKELVEYATAQGAKNAQFYYPNITIMTNKVIGIDKGQRDTLDTRQLCVLQMIETSIRIAIGDGLREQLLYDDIYLLCKDRVSELQPLLKLN
jgi:phage regulator Rha-like protein